MLTVSINLRPWEWNWRPWGYYDDGDTCAGRQASLAFLFLRVDVNW